MTRRIWSGLLAVCAFIAALALFAAWCNRQHHGVERRVLEVPAAGDDVRMLDTTKMHVKLTCYDTLEPDGSVWPYRSTGGRLRPGDCATDPRVIVPGATVVLPVGTALTAVDVGGAVQGYHVDWYRPGSFHDSTLWVCESVEVFVITSAQAEGKE